MEQWKVIPNLNGNYEASNTGRIRRAKPGCGTRPGLVMKKSISRGYERVALSVLGDQFSRSVHRLVAEAFIGEIPGDMEINHKNGIKHDNRVENLEICTKSYNVVHAHEVLKIPQNPPPPSKGQDNGRAKLNDTCCTAIFNLAKLGWTQQQIADLFGIHQTNISRALRGKTGFTIPITNQQLQP